MFERARPEYISHLAALVSVRESLERPGEYAAVNVLGGINLLEMARRYGVRKVIYANTGGALYGEGRGQAPFREDRSPAPLDAYGASKLAFEYYLQVYRHNFGLDYVSLRLPTFTARARILLVKAVWWPSLRSALSAGSPARSTATARKYAILSMRVMWRRRTCGLWIGAAVSTTSPPACRPPSIRCSTQLRPPRPVTISRPAYAPDRPGEVWESCLDAGRAALALGWTPGRRAARRVGTHAGVFP